MKRVFAGNTVMFNVLRDSQTDVLRFAHMVMGYREHITEAFFLDTDLDWSQFTVGKLLIMRVLLGNAPFTQNVINRFVSVFGTDLQFYPVQILNLDEDLLMKQIRWWVNLSGDPLITAELMDALPRLRKLALEYPTAF